MSLTYYYQPTYKIEFWSGSTKLRGFGYSYNNKEVVSFRIKPGLTKALGSFEITLADTGSNASGISTGKAFSNIDVFNKVLFWYGYTGSGLTPTAAEMFTGRIDTKEISWGENGCYRTFIGRDHGEALLRTLERKAVDNTTYNIVLGLKNDASLSSDDTNISGSSSQYQIVLDNTSAFDGIIELSDFDNMDFYVDTGSYLHWFPRQSYEDTSTTIEEGLNIFSYRYVKDLADVKNDYYVFGATITDPISGSFLPTGSDMLTETSTTGWSSWFKAKTGSISTSLTVASYTTGVPGSPATGSACIKTTRPANQVETGTEYEQHLIFDWDSTVSKYLMLNSENIFHSYLSYTISAPVPHTKIQPFIRLYTGTTGSNYFECFLERPIIIDSIVWNEREIILGPNSEGNSSTGSIGANASGSYRWTRNGNPEWYSIRYIDFGMNFTPTDITKTLSEIYYIDGMYFNVPFQYHASGSASINAYGLRTKIINDDKINNTQYAQNMAETLLDMNQNPTTQIEIETLTRPYVMGTKYPVKINSENIDSSFELIDLEHNWSNNALTSKCLFTNQAQKRIPIPIMNYTVQMSEQERYLKRVAEIAGNPIFM